MAVWLWSLTVADLRVRSNRGAEVWQPEGESETVRWFGVDVWRP
jgi:hypothetical protein